MLLAIPFGLAIGLAVGTLGGGGSVLAVPVLVYVLDQSVPDATTASLVVVTAGAIAGGLGHARSGRICWRHAGTFTAAALPGVAVGTIAGEAVSDTLLLGIFSLVMLAAARATWNKASEPPPAEGTWESGGVCPPLRLPRDLVAGAAVGLITGFFGVGGGFFIVPTLAVALAFTMRTAVGTSLAIITATSVMGLIAHLIAGRSFDTGITATMTIACVAGALVGATVGDTDSTEDARSRLRRPGHGGRRVPPDLRHRARRPFGKLVRSPPEPGPARNRRSTVETPSTSASTPTGAISPRNGAAKESNLPAAVCRPNRF